MATQTDQQTTWVKAGELPGKVYADMATEMLETQGIPFYLKSDFMASAFSISTSESSAGVVKIFVPEKFRDEAESILKTVSG
ncbi:MAG: DUF2007 domain-containing protein [Candidatus Marinimicrobia bacterium]|jgi:hypothetical protein|nr:DUF2007 domain-containing protein [Candidatus Neomarinimicrobiota bacterium]MDP6789816.1 DUF2007 domain-containing protein [Candidatus Neomarinimicrobiota bacterium]MDP7071943.1 DUF2007 domain-containing protein [Candidatus Neomarinimicrobiota bacterium]